MVAHETKIVEPTVLPFKCPVCNAWGTVGYKKEICHACKGKGYILVDQKEYDELNRMDKNT